MKRGFFKTAALVLAAASGISAASAAHSPADSGQSPTIAEVFTEMPVSVLDLLDRSTRLDMLDYAAADSVYDATNLLDGVSRLRTLTDSYALVELTDVSTLQIKLLPHKKLGTVIMTLYTVGSPDKALDTGIQFFDAGFRPLKTADLFPALKTKDFFNTADREAVRELEARLPFPSYKMTASPFDATVAVDLTVPTDIDTADRDALLSHIAPPRVLSWNGSRFKMQK